jgi:hypothetical protein
VFRALLTHLQEALHKQNWYIAYYVGWLLPGMEWNWQQSADTIRTQYTNYCYAAPPEDEQVVPETRRGC